MATGSEMAGRQPYRAARHHPQRAGRGGGAAGGQPRNQRETRTAESELMQFFAAGQPASELPGAIAKALAT